MKITFLSKKNTIKKHKRFNPHMFWVFYVGIFFCLLLGEVVYFALFFITTTNHLDEPVSPVLITNKAQIRSIEKRLDAVEEALRKRTGESESSQNTAPMVQ